MRLKELQKMIKEEFDTFMDEQEDMNIDVQGDDVDATGGGENPEETLRSIYNMLKDYFEGDDKEDDVEDVEGGDDEEADLEENSTTAAQYQKTGYAAGKAAWIVTGKQSFNML